MANWPSIANPSLPIGIEPDDPAIRSEAEGGYQLTRPRYTRIRKKFSLQWPAMTKADYATLMTFYNSTAIGGSVLFTFTDPVSGSSCSCRFAGPVRADVVAWGSDQTPRYLAVSVQLQEV